MFETAYTRYYPYAYKTYGDGDSCFIENTAPAACEAAYFSSACNPRKNPVIGYPAYDSRCRNWYQLALSPRAHTPSTGTNSSSGDQQLMSVVQFQYPRVSSGGVLVTTAVAPVLLPHINYSSTSNRSSSGEGWNDTSYSIVGVMSINVLAATLSTSVNEFRILDTGYVFLVDARNVSAVVLHPLLSSSCTTLRCCEPGFTDLEYALFEEKVLQPLQRASDRLTAEEPQVSGYTKSGREFRFATAAVKHGTVDYVLVATVPLSEVLQVSTGVEKSINNSNTGIIIAACFTLFFFVCVIAYATSYIVQGIVGPVQELTLICDRIAGGDLTASNLPATASSSDMQLLLRVFSDMLTALRFGSDSHARGDINAAKKVFEDALVLYTATDQLKGIGACHNNLGAVYMAMGEFDAAKKHFTEAVTLAERATCQAAEVLQNTISRQRLFQQPCCPAPAPATQSVVRIPVARATTGAVACDSVDAYCVHDIASVQGAQPCTLPTNETDVRVYAGKRFHQTDSSAVSSEVSSAASSAAKQSLTRQQQLLSDRRGNLALLLIAQEKYADAFLLLEELMEDDRKTGYIRGCVIKQGNLGNLYLKQGTVNSKLLFFIHLFILFFVVMIPTKAKSLLQSVYF
jgi:tetratricopeptide (TPR) repeat protein